MNKLFKSTVLLSLSLLIAFVANAEITLPSIFGSNMVLQQQTDAAIWGKADPKKEVKVTCSWDNKSYQTTSDKNGRWKLKVKTPTAGGPYSVTITDGTALTLDNVLIGEVWVCSGQSNMWMRMTGYRNQPILGGNEDIATSTNSSLHIFTVENNKSLEPLDDFKGEWKEANPESVADFSATAYYFGRMLQKVLNVPVGLVSTSWGGTRIEPWMTEAELKNFDWVELPQKDLAEFSQQTPTVLYNAMIKPMVGYAIKGALWYQGESNRNEPDRYRQLMPGLVNSWRKAWGIGDFSFYYAQIAPYEYGNGINSAFLREAQLKAADALPNMGMACLMDAGEQYSIHPANKEAAGERLAYQALSKTYGKGGITCEGPMLKEMKIEGGTVYLTFDNAENGLTTFGKELTNFSVAGENKQFVPARAIITREGITLVSEKVTKPVAVRYAFENFVVGELYNTAGIPASSFRTDDWEE